jgi:hypothetical protein
MEIKVFARALSIWYIRGAYFPLTLLHAVAQWLFESGRMLLE